MNKVLKRSLIITGIIVGVFVLAFGLMFLKLNSEMSTFTPMETGPVVDNIFVVKDDFANVFIIKDNTQYIVIDCGISPKTVEEQMKKLGINPNEVSAVFLTHTDSDHTGALGLFDKAKIYLSKEEEQMIDGRKSKFPWFIKTSVGIPRTDYILLENREVIQIGNLKIEGFLAPGHTSGMMAYLLNDKYLFSGDIASLKDGKIAPIPAFFDMDREQAVKSIGIIRHIPTAEYIFTGHWGYTDDYQTAFSQTNSAIKPYADFLNTQHVSSKNYVFNLFEDYDIVILCERDHREITQYDLILDILKDERFSNIQNAYFEIGNSMYNDVLNTFLHNSSLTDEEVTENTLQMQRTLFPLWEKANYSYYLKGVHKINASLPEHKKINIFGLDLGISWEASNEEKIRQKEANAGDRDSIMAVNFIQYYKQSKTKKALVVLNFRHAFLQDMWRSNAGRFIADEFKGKVANVCINSIIIKSSTITDQDVPETTIGTPQDGKWEAAFMKTNKKDLAFDFAGTPFGNDAFDMIPFPNELKYSDVFTGFIHYNYLPDFRVVLGVENYIDDEFYQELISRYKLYDENLPDKDKLKASFGSVRETTYRKEIPIVVEEIEQYLK